MKIFIIIYIIGYIIGYIMFTIRYKKIFKIYIGIISFFSWIMVIYMLFKGYFKFKK